ncbi:MAG TPA: DUF192 domain-containing protein [Nitrososphaeraceae archaeon]|nr:DUF192 domain-containing protein [Nitrososphaeraceae archaeon]
MKAGFTAFAIMLALASLLLLLISFQYVFATEAASQANHTHTNLVKALQDALQNDSEYLRAKVSIEGFELSAEIPVTGELMSKGLSVKNQLRENESMLFVFEEPLRHTFWMKDMKFPIDIIWLDSNGKIVHIEENLMPCPFVLICPSYAPNADSQYVLETIAGFAQRHNISLGTNTKFELLR